MIIKLLRLTIYFKDSCTEVKFNKMLEYSSVCTYICIFVLLGLNVMIVAEDSDPCTTGDDEIYPHSEECQLYYNCSLPETEFKPWLGDHVMECTYPDLFSAESLKCEQFTAENCGNRRKLDFACAYHNNLCNEPLCRMCRNDFKGCNRPEVTRSGNDACTYMTSMKPLMCPKDSEGRYQLLDGSSCRQNR